MSSKKITEEQDQSRILDLIHQAEQSLEPDKGVAITIGRACLTQMQWKMEEQRLSERRWQQLMNSVDQLNQKYSFQN